MKKKKNSKTAPIGWYSLMDIARETGLYYTKVKRMYQAGMLPEPNITAKVPLWNSKRIKPWLDEVLSE